MKKKKIEWLGRRISWVSKNERESEAKIQKKIWERDRET